MKTESPNGEPSEAAVQNQTPTQRVKEIMDSLANGDVRGVAHELTVHQIELEMQNEELRVAEERLGEVRRKFIDHFMSAPIGYVILDPNGKVSEINLSAQALLGATRGGLNGRPFSQMIVTEDLSLFRDSCAQAMSGGKVETVDLRLRTTGGQTVTTRAWIMAVSPRSPYSKDQLRISLLDISTLALDRSKMHRLEEHLNKIAGEIMASDREINFLTHSLSRDIQVCMRTIETCSRELQEACSGGPEDVHQKYALAIESATRKLAHLTADLLQVASIGRSPMTITDVDLSGLVDAAVAEARKRHSERPVATKVAGIIIVKGDSRLLEVAMHNLIHSAWEAVAGVSNPSIEFGIDQSGPGPVYFVRHNGATLDNQQADSLFWPYELLRVPGELPAEGVGLALAARIIQRHSGRIWAAPRPQGGTSFFFTLWTRK